MEAVRTKIITATFALIKMLHVLFK